MTLTQEFRFIVRTVIPDWEQNSNNAVHHTYVNRLGREEREGGRRIQYYLPSRTIAKKTTSFKKFMVPIMLQ